jgi:hypothetical protein
VNFLLDENFPKSASGHLRDLGHTVYDSRALGLSGATDALILKKARELEAMVLSTDRDFFHSLALEGTENMGAIVVALRQPGRAAILSRLQWFLSHVPEAQWSGRTFQLRDSTWLAKPPIEPAV